MSAERRLRPAVHAARVLAAAATLSLAAAGCDLESPSPRVELPWDFAPVSSVATPDPEPSSPERVELGRLLFYDPVLSSDGETACATCHSEIWGMSDGLARSIGVGGGALTGPGRAGPNVTERNAQTLWNVAYREELFWDGRERSLEAQALAPLHNPLELDLAPEDAVTELRSIPEYVDRFASAFPDERDPVSVDTLTRALAAFQRTLVSGDALYDAYASGDSGAMSAEMVEGMWLFATAGCADCHAPPLFESSVYADRGRAGPDDLGRMLVTGAGADRGAFRTPTLRNARDSDPYFHDGSVAALEDAVAHELALSPHGPFDADAAALIATFVGKGLVDRARAPSRPAVVPSGLPVPLDGFRIPR